MHTNLTHASHTHQRSHIHKYIYSYRALLYHSPTAQNETQHTTPHTRRSHTLTHMAKQLSTVGCIVEHCSSSDDDDDIATTTQTSSTSYSSRRARMLKQLLEDRLTCWTLLLRIVFVGIFVWCVCVFIISSRHSISSMPLLG